MDTTASFIPAGVEGVTPPPINTQPLQPRSQVNPNNAMHALLGYNPYNEDNPGLGNILGQLLRYNPYLK